MQNALCGTGLNPLSACVVNTSGRDSVWPIGIAEGNLLLQRLLQF